MYGTAMHDALLLQSEIEERRGGCGRVLYRVNWGRAMWCKMRWRTCCLRSLHSSVCILPWNGMIHGVCTAVLYSAHALAVVGAYYT